MRFDTRRERLIRFANKYKADTGHRQWNLRLGDAALPYSALTTETLEDLREKMLRSYWRNKRTNRLNRAVYAARSVDVTAASLATFQPIFDGLFRRVG